MLPALIATDVDGTLLDRTVLYYFTDHGFSIRALLAEVSISSALAPPAPQNKSKSLGFILASLQVATAKFRSFHEPPTHGVTVALDVGLTSLVGGLL